MQIEGVIFKKGAGGHVEGMVGGVFQDQFVEFDPLERSVAVDGLAFSTRKKACTWIVATVREELRRRKTKLRPGRLLLPNPSETSKSSPA